MSTSPNRVFVGRLTGLQVFDPAGDQVGRVRDLVITLQKTNRPARVVGLVVEVFGRRSIFLPMTRVTSIDGRQVITTGVVNMRRFEQRNNETLAVAQMLDRRVTVRETGVQGTVYDLAIDQQRNRDWVISKVALQEDSKRFGRKGQTHVVDWHEVTGFETDGEQGATHVLAALEEMKPADLATVIHEMPAKRRREIAAALDDERLADVLEELPEEDQVEILGDLPDERAADVLEEMSPDDAADLIAELPPETAENLLSLMEPEEAEDVRRLMSYEERTAGGMMTTEPVVLPPDATVAEALAHVRNADLTPSLAAAVYVCRPPLEPPTGRLIGVAHIQHLLREPPRTMLGAIVKGSQDAIDPAARLEDVARHLAAYNLVAAPVVDEDGRLLGAVTVDDLLDHLLPEGWRERPAGVGRLRV
ncbi:magnesium transporter MgtE N-terminal domain-containing protein [Nocardioides marmoribigeumensis]|uniref:Mg/Co/Ni transporter MgtE n=1 Tax=Nocardioides marmoribigeumensis TaxID=433649 RepID=A0ABU2BXH1_9ACTN|nr:CBS domain-containing protein [Nocardioides marmoribigeumensis]MDR7363092.1 Mg/Co/Ni transporter MgtE [Nocardioides marmoribigeumensis]